MLYVRYEFTPNAHALNIAICSGLLISIRMLTHGDS